MNPQQHVLCVTLCLFTVFIPGLHFRNQPYMLGQLNCDPPSPIGCSKVITVELQVNKTAYDGVCKINSSDQIIFERIEGGQGPAESVRSCNVSNIRQSPCTWLNNKLGCGCMGTTDDFYVLQFSFQAATVTEIYMRASIKCTTHEDLDVTVPFPTCQFPVRTTFVPPKLIENNFKVSQSELTGKGSRTTQPTLWILAGPIATSLLLFFQ